MSWRWLFGSESESNILGSWQKERLRMCGCSHAPCMVRRMDHYQSALLACYCGRGVISSLKGKFCSLCFLPSLCSAQGLCCCCCVFFTPQKPKSYRLVSLQLSLVSCICISHSFIACLWNIILANLLTKYGDFVVWETWARWNKHYKMLFFSFALRFYSTNGKIRTLSHWLSVTLCSLLKPTNQDVNFIFERFRWSTFSFRCIFDDYIQCKIQHTVWQTAWLLLQIWVFAVCLSRASYSLWLALRELVLL